VDQAVLVVYVVELCVVVMVLDRVVVADDHSLRGAVKDPFPPLLVQPADAVVVGTLPYCVFEPTVNVLVLVDEIDRVATGTELPPNDAVSDAGGTNVFIDDELEDDQGIAELDAPQSPVTV
jgi:hypothetical protein